MADTEQCIPDIPTQGKAILKQYYMEMYGMPSVVPHTQQALNFLGCQPALDINPEK